MTTTIAVGDAVLLDGRDRHNLGLVLEVQEVPGEPAPLLTVEVPPSGQLYWRGDEVTRIDKPHVEAGQVWHCDQTGTTVRALEPAWYSPAVWETETLTVRRSPVGTVMLIHPAWRLLAGPDDEYLPVPVPDHGYFDQHSRWIAQGQSGGTS